MVHGFPRGIGGIDQRGVEAVADRPRGAGYRQSRPDRPQDRAALCGRRASRGVVRHSYSAMESELFCLGIDYKHSRPYHPQTCGKVERFHQTLKKFLRKQPRAATIAELQAKSIASSPTTTR